MALYLLVSSRFQVLFHSPPGVLFTFPSRYYSLSVTWSYLALWDGPHFFRQDFSCPDVLRIPLASRQFRLQGFHLLCRTFPSASTIILTAKCGPYPNNIMFLVWASPISLATTFGITVVFFSSGYLDVSVPRVPLITLSIHVMITHSSRAEFPHSDICGSMDICSSPQLFAACHVLLRRHVPRHPP